MLVSCCILLAGSGDTIKSYKGGSRGELKEKKEFELKFVINYNLEPGSWIDPSHSAAAAVAAAVAANHPHHGLVDSYHSEYTR